MTEPEATRPGADQAQLEPARVGSLDQGGKLRNSVAYLAMLVGLVMLVTAVWGFGGFKERTDILRPVPAGQPFSTGPYEFSFSEATVQQTKKADGTISWKVAVLGQGRTTGNEAIGPTFVTSANGIFVLKDPVTGQVVIPDGERYGFDRHNFTPALPPIPYTLSFTLDTRYQPGPILRFGAADLVYGTHFLTTEEKTWHNGTYITLVLLPVRVLPPEKG